MAVAVLVLWVLTAAFGTVLLISVNAARRAAGAASPGPAAGLRAPTAAGVPAEAGGFAGDGAAAGAGAAVALPHQGVPGTTATVPALPPSGPGEPRPIPRVSVHAVPGEHPLLEFSHPALGLLGLGCWFIYVGTSHVALAWVSFGVLAAAVLAGLAWLARSARARSARARSAQARSAQAGPGGPGPAVATSRLALAHGVLAAATVALAVLTALTAAR